MLVFKSKETKYELSMSLMAFKISIEEPPFATPISKHFFGLNFLIMPFMKYACSKVNSHPALFIIFVVIMFLS
jgi:hypothetical protein